MSISEKIENFLIILKFEGTGYHGWQIQKNALTVQEIFQSALFKLMNRKTEIKGCSRTDSGVHANVYCVSARMQMPIKEYGFLSALNNLLPKDIAAVKCLKVGLKFHARYSCTSKEYIYKLYNRSIRDPFLINKAMHYPRSIDLELIRNAAKNFLGTHDFTSFCVSCSKIENKIKTIYDFEIKKTDNLFEFRIKADGFLHNMARIMVGTLLKINQGKIKLSVSEIIALKNRKYAGFTVPACGLYLNKVFYPGMENIF